jgi:hypothetical protein
MLLRDLRSVVALRTSLVYAKTYNTGGNKRGHGSPWDDWWLTANPSDLRNPLVLLVLAGVEFSHESMPRTDSEQQQRRRSFLEILDSPPVDAVSRPA